MHLLALILGIWLLPKGDTLKCYECIPDILGNCFQMQKECPSKSHLCGASSATMRLDRKGCFLPDECGEGSANYGLDKTSVNTQCCNSNLCNNYSAPALDLINTTPNGRQCFTCFGTCDRILACKGNEDHCITVKARDPEVFSTFAKGCVSKQLCYSSLFQYSGSRFSCCKGNLCNSAVTASAGLQLVVVMLVSLTLFT